MLRTNEERFQVLYWKYQNLVIHVARSRINDYHHAQDICQETFMKMFRYVDLSQSDETIRAWLVVVADNMAKDLLKKGGKYRQMYEADITTVETARVLVSGNEYFDEIIRKDFRSRILDHLQEVNPEQFEIVSLVCCLQMSVGDVAKRMHMTYNQVSMKLYRARSWIRAHYLAEYQEIKA